MRATSFGVGLILAALAAQIALGGDGIETPGGDQRQILCRPGYSRSQRVDAAAWRVLKHQVAARQGIPWSQAHRYELDHIVPLCLGGSNDLANLQLEPWAEAREKDIGERQACRDYCRGKISLNEARALFTRD